MFKLAFLTILIITKLLLFSSCSTPILVKSKYSNSEHLFCGYEKISPIYPVSSVHNHNEFTKIHYPKRIKEFKNDPLRCGEIIFLGDSLTENNDWQSALNVNIPIRNRGISGDTTDGMLSRINEIIVSNPKAVFLMGGTNDLWTTNSDNDTFNNLMTIAKSIRAYSPETIIIIQTLFPVNVDKKLNDKVKSINKQILKMKDKINNVMVLDTNSLVRTEDGMMYERYTHDGIHLNDDGYEIWVSNIKKIILIIN